MSVPLNLHFGPLTAADLPAVLAIEEAAYAYPWTMGNFADSLRDDHLCEGLWLDGVLVGYSVLAPMVDEVHVLNCCVAPAWQRRGLGRRLMRQALSRVPGLITGLSADFPFASVLLEVRAGNAAALSLYRALGFSEIGRRKAYYPATAGREDAIVMRRPLAAASLMAVAV